jgi:hypothetical protein
VWLVELNCASQDWNMYALRETPPSDPADLVVRLLLLPVMGGRSGAHTYSSDKVVKFGVRGVSNGSSADLKLYTLLMSRLIFAKQWSLLDRLRYWGL